MIAVLRALVAHPLAPAPSPAVVVLAASVTVGLAILLVSTLGGAILPEFLPRFLSEVLRPDPSPPGIPHPTGDRGEGQMLRSPRHPEVSP